MDPPLEGGTLILAQLFWLWSGMRLYPELIVLPSSVLLEMSSNRLAT